MDYWLEEDKDKSIKDFYLTKINEDRDTIFIKLVFADDSLIAANLEDYDSVNINIIRPDLFIDAETGISLSRSEAWGIPLVRQYSDAEIAITKAFEEAVERVVNITLALYALLLMLAGKIAG